MTNQMSQNLSWFRQPGVSNYLMTDTHLWAVAKDVSDYEPVRRDRRQRWRRSELAINDPSRSG